ncbi:hypothetical protein KIN20_037940 [Parelaphostrongylus tenuis]|uniref:Uncharacterized protein n=1 Tax=Parelaphostrongylus tenuis TaxID=148309 RepID=A0AAD5RF08_PARTN|nr:hypothetical protein KIN20_037940 [Parelaphostrongylus tenuis]
MVLRAACVTSSLLALINVSMLYFRSWVLYGSGLSCRSIELLGNNHIISADVYKKQFWKMAASSEETSMKLCSVESSSKTKYTVEIAKIYLIYWVLIAYEKTLSDEKYVDVNQNIIPTVTVQENKPLKE